MVSDSNRGGVYHDNVHEQTIQMGQSGAYHVDIQMGGEHSVEILSICMSYGIQMEWQGPPPDPQPI